MSSLSVFERTWPSSFTSLETLASTTQIPRNLTGTVITNLLRQTNLVPCTSFYLTLIKRIELIPLQGNKRSTNTNTTQQINKYKKKQQEHRR
jgi:hypothetical protein